MATILASSLNLTANLVGAGLLSLPWALKEAGVLVGLIQLAIIMCLSMASFCVIGVCCQRTGLYNFRDMVSQHLGGGAAILVQLCNMGYACGSCISYVVLMADSLTGQDGAIEYLFGKTMLSDRSFTIGVCGLFILLPLCLLPDLNNLRYASTFTIFIKIIWTIFLFRAAWLQHEVVGEDATVQWCGSLAGAYLAIPVLNVAYCAHYNAPRYYEELADRSAERFRAVVIIASGLTTVSYVLSAVAAYYIFGDRVQGNVLNNFAAGYWPARLGHAVVVVCTFPLAHHSIRTGVLALAGRDPNRVDPAWTAVTIVGVMVLLGLSTGITAVQKVLVFKGAVFGSIIVFVFPPVLLLSIRRKTYVANPWVDLGLVSMIVWGCGTLVVGAVLAAAKL